MQSNNTEYDVFCLILNYGMATKAMKIARKTGLKNSSAFIGYGTIESPLLDMLSLNEVRKEIVVMISDRNIGNKALDDIDKVLKFYKPNHGIAFSMPLNRFIKSSEIDYYSNTIKSRSEENMYEAIFVIVDKGKGEFVVDSAKKAGSKGATLINARGSDPDEIKKVFAMEIEPEKEIILILSEISKTNTIVDQIKDDLNILEPGAGIIFTCDTNRTLGIYSDRK